MSKNDGGLFGEPFFGIFDFNNDGHTDIGEEFLGYQIFKECMGDDDNDSIFGDDSSSDDDTDIFNWRDFCEDGFEFGVDPEDYEDEDEYLEALNEAKYGWRKECEDGSEVDVLPEDYETQTEYEDALEEALEEAQYGWRDNYSDDYMSGILLDDYETEKEYLKSLEEAGVPPIILDYEESIPDLEIDRKSDENTENPNCNTEEKIEEEIEKEIKESDYPNKRRYEASSVLNDEYMISSKNENDKKDVACCKFIINKSDTVLAANYLIYDIGFVYAKAIKDNISLPVHLPDEDNMREMELYEVLQKIAKKDISLCFQVWEWCLAHFMPYAQYDEYCLNDLSANIIDELCGFPKEFEFELAKYMESHPDFKIKVISENLPLSSGLPEIIVAAISQNFLSMAKGLFTTGIKQANGEWKKLNSLIGSTITCTENGEELESAEYVKNELLPIVKTVDIGMVQDKIEEWEKRLNDYIADTECNSEKYAYTRINAWRKNVPDGKQYGLNPCYYDSEEEYMECYNEEKYGWREWYSEDDTLGLNLNDFETEESFEKELKIRTEEQRRNKKAEENEKILKAYETDAEIQNDKNIYIYCGIKFESTSNVYSYRTEDETIKIGDTVIVPAGENGKENKGKVVFVGHYTRTCLPYPLEKAKFVLRKEENK